MAYINTVCTGRVTIFSTGSKFRPVSNFMYLHALPLAACSYALLTYMRSINALLDSLPEAQSRVNTSTISHTDTVNYDASYVTSCKFCAILQFLHNGSMRPLILHC